MVLVIDKDKKLFSDYIKWLYASIIHLPQSNNDFKIRVSDEKNNLTGTSHFHICFAIPINIKIASLSTCPVQF